MTVKVVLLNAGGTLLRLANNNNIPSAYASALSSIIKPSPTVESVTRALYKAEQWVLSRKEQKLLSEREQLRYLAIFYKNLGILDRRRVRQIDMELADKLTFEFEPEEGAIELLQELSKNYKLGLISNWDESLYDILTEFDMVKYFKSITLSVDVGYNKPDYTIFEEALKDFKGIKRKTMVYIGDRYDVDILPASQLGLKTILYNPPISLFGFPLPERVNCPVVTHLSQIITIINQLNEKKVSEK